MLFNKQLSYHVLHIKNLLHDTVLKNFIINVELYNNEIALSKKCTDYFQRSRRDQLI